MNQFNIPPIVQDVLEAGIQSARTMSTKIAGKIKNIRYGEPGKLCFDINNTTETIPEPMDVLLVGIKNTMLANTYIARKHFAQLAKYAKD